MQLRKDIKKEHVQGVCIQKTATVNLAEGISMTNTYLNIIHWDVLMYIYTHFLSYMIFFLFFDKFEKFNSNLNFY